MKHKKLLIAGLAIALLIGIVSAATIPWFGQIKTTAEVDQAVLVDGIGYGDMPIEDSIGAVGGESVCRYHWLTSQTSEPVDVQFETTEEDGIDVKYYETLGYYKEETFVVLDKAEVKVGDLKVTVEDGGCWVTWTFDFPVEGQTGDGQISAFVAIHLDGIAFLVHNNDGVNPNYPAGTWLYTVYDEGWHCDIGTPVSGIDWIKASGSRYAQGTDGILQIRISKCALGETFSYIARSWTGTGWFNIKYGQYFTIGTEDWLNWDGYEPAELMTEITSPFTLQPKEYVDFIICYEFATNIKAGTYTITTTIEPAD